jgi:septal ring factor EnvC (AmiA/AmiB activator)
VINVQSEEELAIELNASRFARKRVRLILRSLVKRSRFTLRSSQSRSELERLQAELRRLEEKLQRLQNVQQTFAINVKCSFEKLRASQEDSQKKQKTRDDSRKKRNDSQEHIEQKEVQILQELLRENVVFSKKENIQLSQHEANSVSSKRIFASQNFEFVEHNSQRNHNANETTYRVAYINK